jgi:hypothetical protein
MATTAEVLKELARKGYLDARTTGNVLRIQDTDLVLPRNASKSRARDLATWAINKLQAMPKMLTTPTAVAPEEPTVVTTESTVEPLVEPEEQAVEASVEPAPRRRRRSKVETEVEVVED